MNTSIIKKETTEQNMQPVVKISRAMKGISSHRKKDLVTMLREENDSLYEEYLLVIKRNVELRAIVDKQQKLINAIYNAELNIIFPAEEKVASDIELPAETLQKTAGIVPDIESFALETPIPEIEPRAVETPVPEIKPPQPLGLNDLAKRIYQLQRKKWQSQKSIIEKTKFLLAIYNASDGIKNDELFAVCGITRITGIRYVTFFRKFSMVSHGGKYSITNLGKKFVEGELNTEWDKYRVKRWRIIH